MASLVDQILAQSQAGSAGGEHLASSFATGIQLGQRQQQINLEKQQLAVELAQLPLKQTLMQQSAEMNKLKLTEALETRDLQIKNESALREAYNLAGQALASGSPEDAEGYVMDIMSRTVGAGRDTRFQTLLKDVRDSASAKLQLQTLRNSVSDDRLRIQEERLALERDRQRRLQDQFDFQRTRFERTIPADKLALFRERAAQIRNDFSLIGDPAAAEAKLAALAKELGIGQTAAPASTAAIPEPAAPPAPPAKVRVRKAGKEYLLPASQLEEAIRQGYEQVK